MGTNYYWHEKPNPCDSCGHDESKVIHIGKSSLGWVFMLHVDSEEGLNTLEDWKDRWSEPGSLLISEYGTRIAIDKLLDVILDRGNTEAVWSVKKMAENQASPGPNGLVRGVFNFQPPNDETYDLVDGVFS